MNLEEIRVQIDGLDQQITKLLLQRMELSKEVAAYKKANGLPVYVPEREAKVIEKVTSLVPDEYHEAMEAIYHCLMDESKKTQNKWLEQ